MSHQLIKDKIEAYRRKRYRNDILRGTIFFLFVSISTFFALSVLENQFWFDSTVRTIFFVSLIGVTSYWASVFVIKPVTELYRLRKGIRQADLAKEIGLSFPEVKDKLLNYLQLSDSQSKNDLLIAALNQKTSDLQVVNFESSINVKNNLKYAYWLVGLIGLVFTAAFVSPSIISDSPSRLVNFNKEYNKPAPFSFNFQDTDYQIFMGDKFETRLQLIGQNIPDEITIIRENKSAILRPDKTGAYIIRFKNITEKTAFLVSAAGFKSPIQQIKVVPRPELIRLSLAFDYPKYTNLEDETIDNTGSKVVPQGTKITWSVVSKNSSNTLLVSESDTSVFDSVGESLSVSRRIMEDFDYSIALANAFGSNKTPINYSIEVIEDKAPNIDMIFIPDTILFQHLILSGSINDDYGFNTLYARIKESESGHTHTLNINFNRKSNDQSFLQVLDIKPFMKNSSSIEVAVYVVDNDQVNGPKLAKSQTYYFEKPNKKELEKKLSEQNKQAESKLKDSKSKSQEISKQLEDLDKKLKSKKDIGWQEEKMIENIVKDRQKIEKDLNELKKEHEELLQMQEKLDPRNKDLTEKSKELQKLIEELLDEETKKLYDELQKLLAEQADAEKVKEQVSKINKKENNLEEELERTLELFKRMKLEMEVQKAANDLEKLSTKQEELANKDKSSENNAENQKEINEEFKDIQEKLEELNELNQSLTNPEPISDFNDDASEIQEKLDEISKEMKSSDSNNTKQKQKNAAGQMKEMAIKMQQMQSGMEMEMMQENMQDLENIIDNLVKLSFEEERLIKEFQQVSQVDPRFLELSQDQLKLIKNAEVVKDSLVSLASRVVQISNFITREVNQINENLDDAMKELRERNKNKATSHQQYAMTSINNLALLLGDVLEQMQMAMSEAMGKPKPGDKQQQGLPDMSQIQKQLGKQIQELKKSGKSGRQLSEELAKLAAEQSMLREEMKRLQEQLESQPENSGTAKSLKDIIEKMEQNESDLVNKRLTDNLINRQEDILTRMLEANESLREQKESPEREAESAKDNYNDLTPAFEEYLKAKQAEIELLKTIPLDLSPFYKKEVNDYFQRLSGDN